MVAILVSVVVLASLVATSPHSAEGYPQGNLSNCLNDNGTPTYSVTWRRLSWPATQPGGGHDWAAWSGVANSWTTALDYDNVALVAVQHVTSNPDFEAIWVTDLPSDVLGGVTCETGQFKLNHTFWDERAQDSPTTVEAEFKHFIRHEVGHMVGLGHTAKQSSPAAMQTCLGLPPATPISEFSSANRLDDLQSLYAYLSKDEPWGMEVATYNNSFETSILASQWNWTGTIARSTAAGASGTSSSAQMTAPGPYTSHLMEQTARFMPNETGLGTRNGHKFRGRVQVRGVTANDLGPFTLEVWAREASYIAGNGCSSEYNLNAYDNERYQQYPSVGIWEIRASQNSTLSGTVPTDWRIVSTPEWSSPDWDSIEARVRFVNSTFRGCCAGGQVYVDLLRLAEKD